MSFRLLVAVTLAVLLSSPGTARAAIPLTRCGDTPGLRCGQVAVPLDRTGLTPGTVSLHVEILPPAEAVQGAMFLVAGGPGQGSARSFELGSEFSADVLRTMLPGYTLVAFDNRGTGASGALRCPALQTTFVTTVQQEAALIGECAGVLGPARQFYATRDHVEDIEDVRVALGLGRIGLYGVSYGTKLSLGYAMAHPESVERLLLDSVVPTSLPDPFGGNVLRELPGTLRAFCAGGRCRAATPDFAGDLVVLANRLAAQPARAKILALGGRAKTVQLDGVGLLAMVVDADLNPGLAAELPAAVRAARTGYARPLLRLSDIDQRTFSVPAEELSFALNVATNCADGEFPWAAGTPVTERPALLDAAVGALPQGSLGLFGNWSAQLGTAYECERWPEPAGNTPLVSHALPDVPVLAISGGFDLRTPTASARSVVSLFPQGRLLVVPGVGHSVLGMDLSFCSTLFVMRWIRGASLPKGCPRVPPFVKAVDAFPRGAAQRSPGSTLRIATTALHEAEATWLQTAALPGNLQPAGVYGGRLSTRGSGFVLTRYAITPGVFLTGRLTVATFSPPFAFKGAIRVTGPRAVTGTLRVSRGRVAGTLGGRRVSAQL